MADISSAYHHLGNAYDESGRYQEAIKAFKQAIKLNPDYYANAHHTLAFVYAKLGHYDEAIQACKQAIKLQPDDAGAHYGLGVVYLLMKDKGSSLEEYKTLKTLNPELANKLFNEIYK